MNKKTKSFAVGLVAVLCFLLVFAIGFGVTGAWYQARRRATGTVQLNQGIKLTLTNIQTLEDGDLSTENKLKGELLQGESNKSNLTKLETSGVPNDTKYVAIPTVKAAAGSVNFYLKAKVEYSYLLWSDGTRTTLKGTDGTGATAKGYKATELYTEAGEAVAGDSRFIAKGLTFDETKWVESSSNGWYVYGSALATPTEMTSSDAENVKLFKADEVSTELNLPTNADGYAIIKLADWTSEFGGPQVRTSAETGDDTNLFEVGQIIVTVTFEVIQSANLQPSDIATWVAAA